MITDLPVQSCKDAIEKIHWYAMRWKIETFHKILNLAAEPRNYSEELQSALSI